MENLLLDKNEKIIEILKQCRDENEAQLVLRGNNIYLTREDIKNIKEQFNKTFNEDEILTPEQLENIAGGGMHFHFIAKKATEMASECRKNEAFAIGRPGSQIGFKIIGIEWKDDAAGLYIHIHENPERVDAEHQGKVYYSPEQGFKLLEGPVVKKEHIGTIISAINEKLPPEQKLTLPELESPNPPASLPVLHPTPVNPLNVPDKKLVEPEKTQPSVQAQKTPVASPQHSANFAQTGKLIKHLQTEFAKNQKGKNSIVKELIKDPLDKAIFDVIANQESTTPSRRTNGHSPLTTPPTSPTVVHPQPQRVSEGGPHIVATPPGTPLKAAADLHNTLGEAVNTHDQPPVQYFAHSAYVKKLLVPEWITDTASQFESLTWEKIYEFLGTTEPQHDTPDRNNPKQYLAFSLFSELCICEDGISPQAENFSKALYIANTICHDNSFITYLTDFLKEGVTFNWDDLYVNIIDRMHSLNLTPTPELDLAATPGGPTETTAPTESPSYDDYKKTVLPTLQKNILPTLGDGRCMDNAILLSLSKVDPAQTLKPEITETNTTTQSGSRVKLIEQVKNNPTAFAKAKEWIASEIIEIHKHPDSYSTFLNVKIDETEHTIKITPKGGREVIFSTSDFNNITITDDFAKQFLTEYSKSSYWGTVNRDNFENGQRKASISIVDAYAIALQRPIYVINRGTRCNPFNRNEIEAYDGEVLHRFIPAGCEGKEPIIISLNPGHYSGVDVQKLIQTKPDIVEKLNEVYNNPPGDHRVVGYRKKLLSHEQYVDDLLVPETITLLALEKRDKELYRTYGQEPPSGDKDENLTPEQKIIRSVITSLGAYEYSSEDASFKSCNERNLRKAKYILNTLLNDLQGRYKSLDTNPTYEAIINKFRSIIESQPVAQPAAAAAAAVPPSVSLPVTQPTTPLEVTVPPLKAESKALESTKSLKIPDAIKVNKGEDLYKTFNVDQLVEGKQLTPQQHIIKTLLENQDKLGEKEPLRRTKWILQTLLSDQEYIKHVADTIDTGQQPNFKNIIDRFHEIYSNLYKFSEAFRTQNLTNPFVLDTTRQRINSIDQNAKTKLFEVLNSCSDKDLLVGQTPIENIPIKVQKYGEHFYFEYKDGDNLNHLLFQAKDKQSFIELTISSDKQQILIPEGKVSDLVALLGDKFELNGVTFKKETAKGLPLVLLKTDNNGICLGDDGAFLQVTETKTESTNPFEESTVTHRYSPSDQLLKQILSLGQETLTNGGTFNIGGCGFQVRKSPDGKATYITYKLKDVRDTYDEIACISQKRAITMNFNPNIKLAPLSNVTIPVKTQTQTLQKAAEQPKPNAAAEPIPPAKAQPEPQVKPVEPVTAAEPKLIYEADPEIKDPANPGICSKVIKFEGNKPILVDLPAADTRNFAQIEGLILPSLVNLPFPYLFLNKDKLTPIHLLPDALLEHLKNSVNPDTKFGKLLSDMAACRKYSENIVQLQKDSDLVYYFPNEQQPKKIQPKVKSVPDEIKGKWQVLVTDENGNKSLQKLSDFSKQNEGIFNRINGLGSQLGRLCEEGAPEHCVISQNRRTFKNKAGKTTTIISYSVLPLINDGIFVPKDTRALKALNSNATFKLILEKIQELRASQTKVQELTKQGTPISDYNSWFNKTFIKKDTSTQEHAEFQQDLLAKRKSNLSSSASNLEGRNLAATPESTVTLSSASKPIPVTPTKSQDQGKNNIHIGNPLSGSSTATPFHTSKINYGTGPSAKSRKTPPSPTQSKPGSPVSPNENLFSLFFSYDKNTARQYLSEGNLADENRFDTIKTLIGKNDGNVKQEAFDQLKQDLTNPDFNLDDALNTLRGGKTPEDPIKDTVDRLCQIAQDSDIIKADTDLAKIDDDTKLCLLLSLSDAGRNKLIEGIIAKVSEQKAARKAVEEESARKAAEEEAARKAAEEEAARKAAEEEAARKAAEEEAAKKAAEQEAAKKAAEEEAATPEPAQPNKKAVQPTGAAPVPSVEPSVDEELKDYLPPTGDNNPQPLVPAEQQVNQGQPEPPKDSAILTTDNAPEDDPAQNLLNPNQKFAYQQKISDTNWFDVGVHLYTRTHLKSQPNAALFSEKLNIKATPAWRKVLGATLMPTAVAAAFVAIGIAGTSASNNKDKDKNEKTKS